MSSDHAAQPGGPTVVGMIYDTVQRIEKKQDKLAECNAQMKKDIERNNGRLYTHDEKFKALDAHISDDKRHWNPKLADEGAAGYIARNKLKIAIITTLTTLITVGGTLLINWLQNLGG